MTTVDATSYDQALSDVVVELGKIAAAITGVMPEATWLQVVRLHVEQLAINPPLTGAPAVDAAQEARLEAVEQEVASLKATVLAIHDALSSAPTPATVQRAMSEVEPPKAE